MTDLPETFERLTARLEVLERRVEALEHPAVSIVSQPVKEPIAGPVAPLAPEANEGFSLAQAGGLFPVLGKAMLGIAGAYLLRAVAESSSLPKLAIAAIAIAYAIMWLVWAVRIPAGAWLASAVYAGTSALILAPMLWELTLKFNVLSPAATASVLGAFVIAASVLAWKRDLAPVFWVANVTASVTALALSIATKDLLPFIAALLLMVLIGEYAAERNHELSIRPLVAFAADAAILILIFIYSRPQEAHADYPAHSAAGLLLPGCVIFAVYAASITFRTAFQRQRISIFEASQAIVAFLLATCSVLSFEAHIGAVLLGAVCLLVSIACYAAAYAFFDRESEPRNYHVFASWAAGLLLVGSLLCLPGFGLTVCLGAAAILASILGLRFDRHTLKFHGLFFLTAAAIQSDLLQYAFDALAGSLPSKISWGACLITACALVCYLAARPVPAESGRQQILRLVPAALVVCFMAAILVQGLVWLATLGMTLDVYHIAFIRTLITCMVALALAFAGSRWQRSELTRIAYATLAFVAAKLVFEDLRHGHLEFIAASIFLFAITLIAVPRLARMGEKA